MANGRTHEATRTARLAGRILCEVYENQKRQDSRYSHLHLHDFLEALHISVSENELITLLQDLKERGYLDFHQHKDRKTHEVFIREIQITPAGRDVALRRKTDDAVRIE